VQANTSEFFQVRKSFFNDLNINNNVTIVDLLYQQFYTGSETYPTPEEQEFMKSLFTSGQCGRSKLLPFFLNGLGFFFFFYRPPPSLTLGWKG
jgi:hypothetical protein